MSLVEVGNEAGMEIGELRPLPPWPSAVAASSANVYRRARAAGLARRTAAGFAALHVVQRVSYYAGWRFGARHEAARGQLRPPWAPVG
jgi:hypothetical protein